MPTKKTSLPTRATSARNTTNLSRQPHKKAATQPATPLPPASVQIISSSHLVSERLPQLSEFEFGIIIVWHAFSRWIVRCMSAVGVKDMTPIDVLILHHTNHRDRGKRIADIGFALNIEDTHVVTYSLKKLVRAELIQSVKRGKEVFFSTTERGNALCMKYCAVREACLISGFADPQEEGERMAELARALRSLSGYYDQAARAATVY